MAIRRQCHFCDEPTVSLVEGKHVRLGIIEQRFQCSGCGQEFKTFNPWGNIAWWSMIGLLVVGAIAAFAVGKVKDGDGPGIVVGLCLLLGALAFIGVRALHHGTRRCHGAGWMGTRAFVMIALAGWSCGTPQRPPSNEQTADPSVAAEVAKPSVAAEVASSEDQQRAKELADAVCGCVREVRKEVACVRDLQATAPRGLPRSDPGVARQIERARTCVRLAELQQLEDRPMFVRFVEGLFR